MRSKRSKKEPKINLTGTDFPEQIMEKIAAEFAYLPLIVTKMTEQLRGMPMNEIIASAVEKIASANGAGDHSASRKITTSSVGNFSGSIFKMNEFVW